MPITKSVEKRVRQAENRRQYNQHYKSQMRSLVKKVLQTDSREAAEPLYREAVSMIDRIAGKGIIHKNKAGREKRKLTRHFNSLS